MASMTHRSHGISRLWHLTSAFVGTALMAVLLLHATPALAQQNRVANYEAAIIDQAEQKVVAQDCLRFSLSDGAFRSDIFSGFGFPDGLWNIVGVAEGTVISAFMNAIVTTESGQQVPYTISLGGHVDESGSTIEAALVLSNGLRYTVLATVKDQCAVPASATRQHGEHQEFDY